MDLWFLAPVTMFLVFGAIGFSWTPLGKAIAARLNRDNQGGGADVDELREEVHELRRQLEEVHERLDFTERVIARSRSEALGAGRREDERAS